MILGVDPGSVSAAYAVLEDDGKFLEVGDVPVVDKMVDAANWDQILKFFGFNPEDKAVIEQVSAMPKQGVSSSFRFGMGCGLIRGVMVTYGLPTTQVAPTKWKKHFGLNSDAEKSRALALRYYPEASKQLNLKKHHGRAEALLMARWYLETHK